MSSPLLREPSLLRQRCPHVEILPVEPFVPILSIIVNLYFPPGSQDPRRLSDICWPVCQKTLINSIYCPSAKSFDVFNGGSHHHWGLPTPATYVPFVGVAWIAERGSQAVWSTGIASNIDDRPSIVYTGTLGKFARRYGQKTTCLIFQARLLCREIEQVTTLSSSTSRLYILFRWKYVNSIDGRRFIDVTTKSRKRDQEFTRF